MLLKLFQQAKADGKPVNVAEIMDTWILQMGYPVVTVTRSLDGATANVTQSRFLRDPLQNPSTKYTSPFGYAFPSVGKRCPKAVYRLFIPQWLRFDFNQI